MCEGLACGPDGCGGTCGVCPENKPVCYLGKCKKCAPDCMLKECGPDGCGGSCGDCPSVFTCATGKCIAPECSGSVLLFEEKFDDCTQGSLVIVDEQADDSVTWWALPVGEGENTCDLYLGDPVTGAYETGSSVHLKLMTPELEIPSGTFKLTMRLKMEAEPVPAPKYPYDYDVLFLSFEASAGKSTPLWSSKEILNSTQGETITLALDVSGLAPGKGRFLFEFNTFDSTANDYAGVHIDDLRLDSICPFCGNDEDCSDGDECTQDSCLMFANAPDLGACVSSAIPSCESEEPDM